MSTYIEVIAIFIFCIFLYPNHDFTVQSLIFVLLAFIITCFLTSLKNEKVKLFLLISAMITCILLPDFAVFLPAMLYNSCHDGKYVLPGVGVLLALYCKHQTIRDTAALLIAFLISYYLAVRSSEREKLQTTILRLRDNSVEQEMRLNRKNEQLLSSQNEEIFVATLKERNRIAREIHDNVGHTLSRSILQVGALLAICKDEMLKPHLMQLKDSLDDAMNNIRNSVHDLHDESVDLQSSLQTLIDNFSFCDITFQCDVSRHVPKDIKYCFIAVTKEALNNIIKHSNATKVNVTVKEHPGLYQLLIEDNGTTEFLTSDSSGIGLSNMRDRAAALNGIIRITAEHGVKIFLSVPKKSTIDKQ